MDKRLENWCDRVVSEVRFWVDRSKIRAELEAHIEDHCAALEELNYPSELAAERTLAAMGDPVAVGKALDKEHSPWLGWLWVVSIAAVFVMGIMVIEETWESHGTLEYFWKCLAETVSPMPYEERWEELDETFDYSAAYGQNYTCIGTGSAEAVDIGKWKVEIPKAVWWDRYGKFTYVAILLEVTPERPWYGCGFQNIGELVMTDSNGERTPGHSARMYVGQGSDFPWFLARGSVKSLWGSSHLIGVTIEGDADWVELSWFHGDSPWTLRVYKEGAA